MNVKIFSLLVAVVCIALIGSYFVGRTVSQKNERQIERELRNGQTRLAWKVLHACGKDWHMVDWAPFGGGEIIIDCAPNQTLDLPYYTTKSVIARR